MDEKLIFKRETHFQGRNGYFRCSGFKVDKFVDNIVDIYPLTSRGVTGNCHLEIPVEEINNLIKVLNKIKDGNTL